jgi:hypothetical protein
MHAQVLALSLIFGISNPYLRPVNSDSPQAASLCADTSISLILNRVGAVDDPTLRVFLRLRIAIYLWGAPSGTACPDHVATAAEGVEADLRDHDQEMPKLYARSLRQSFLAQLKLHDPVLAARLTGGHKPERHTDFQVAYSLLAQKGGASMAVGLAQRSLAGGEDPGGAAAAFFLHKLDKESPAEVSKLLDAVVTAEERRPGSFSADTLLTLKHMFLRGQTPQDLQSRYLSTVINRAGDKDADLSSVTDFYIVLADALPLVEKQLPSLYGTAGARLSELAGRMPARTLERIDLGKRLSQSADPFGQLMIELDSAKDPSLRQALLAEAAPRALANGRLRTAVDLAVQVNPAAGEDAMWRDQLLGEVVENALTSKDAEVAKYAASHIQSPAVHSSALQKIALYFRSADDLTGAREALDAARKLTESAEAGVDKATALLDLAGTFTKVDEQRAWEIADAAVEIINHIPPPDRKAAPGSTERLSYAENMMKIAYRIVPAFHALGVRNLKDAVKRAEDITHQGLSLAAELGARTGVPSVDKKAGSLASK